jgi:hypothetical protein
MAGVEGRLGTVVELFRYVYGRKQWWLIPLLVIVLLTGLLIVFAQFSAVTRFVYPGF